MPVYGIKVARSERWEQGIFKFQMTCLILCIMCAMFGQELKIMLHSLSLSLRHFYMTTLLIL